MNLQEREALFSEIMSQAGDRLYRLCFGYLYAKSEVDDLYQDVLVNIWQSLPRFRREAGIQTWAYRVAVNTALVYNRRLVRSRRASSEHPHSVGESSGSPEEYAVRSSLLDRLRLCISKLSRADRLLATLLLEELSYREMAEILGITVANVGVRINRLKQKLEQCMRENHGTSMG